MQALLALIQKRRTRKLAVDEALDARIQAIDARIAAQSEAFTFEQRARAEFTAEAKAATKAAQQQIFDQEVQQRITRQRRELKAVLDEKTAFSGPQSISFSNPTVTNRALAIGSALLEDKEKVVQAEEKIRAELRQRHTDKEKAIQILSEVLAETVESKIVPPAYVELTALAKANFRSAQIALGKYELARKNFKEAIQHLFLATPPQDMICTEVEQKVLGQAEVIQAFVDAKREDQLLKLLRKNSALFDEKISESQVIRGEVKENLMLSKEVVEYLISTSSRLCQLNNREINKLALYCLRKFPLFALNPFLDTTLRTIGQNLTKELAASKLAIQESSKALLKEESELSTSLARLEEPHTPLLEREQTKKDKPIKEKLIADLKIKLKQQKEECIEKSNCLHLLQGYQLIHSLLQTPKQNHKQIIDLLQQAPGQDVLWFFQHVTSSNEGNYSAEHIQWMSSVINMYCLHMVDETPDGMILLKEFRPHLPAKFFPQLLGATFCRLVNLRKNLPLPINQTATDQALADLTLFLRMILTPSEQTEGKIHALIQEALTHILLTPNLRASLTLDELILYYEKDIQQRLTLDQKIGFLKYCLHHPKITETQRDQLIRNADPVSYLLPLLRAQLDDRKKSARFSVEFLLDLFTKPEIRAKLTLDQRNEFVRYCLFHPSTTLTQRNQLAQHIDSTLAAEVFLLPPSSRERFGIEFIFDLYAKHSVAVKLSLDQKVNFVSYYLLQPGVTENQKKLLLQNSDSEVAVKLLLLPLVNTGLTFQLQVVLYTKHGVNAKLTTTQRSEFVGEFLLSPGLDPATRDQIIQHEEKELPTFVSLKTHEKYRTARLQIGRYYLAQNNYNQVFYWVFDYWRPEAGIYKSEELALFTQEGVFTRMDFDRQWDILNTNLEILIAEPPAKPCLTPQVATRVFSPPFWQKISYSQAAKVFLWLLRFHPAFLMPQETERYSAALVSSEILPETLASLKQMRLITKLFDKVTLSEEQKLAVKQIPLNEVKRFAALTSPASNYSTADGERVVALGLLF